MLNTVYFIDKDDFKQIGNATARINDLQSALSKAETMVLLLVSAYFQAKQKEQEHQTAENGNQVDEYPPAAFVQIMKPAHHHAKRRQQQSQRMYVFVSSDRLFLWE